MENIDLDYGAALVAAGANKPLYFGHPEFEGFTVIQEVKAKGRAGSRAAE
jgi:hypothetical protein